MGVSAHVCARVHAVRRATFCPASHATTGDSHLTSLPHPPHPQKKDIGDRKAILARRSQIAKRSTAKPQTVGEKLAARAKKFVTLRKAEKAKSQPSACAWAPGAEGERRTCRRAQRGGAWEHMPPAWEIVHHETRLFTTSHSSPPLPHPNASPFTPPPRSQAQGRSDRCG